MKELTKWLISGLIALGIIGSIILAFFVPVIMYVLYALLALGGIALMIVSTRVILFDKEDEE